MKKYSVYGNGVFQGIVIAKNEELAKIAAIKRFGCMSGFEVKICLADFSNSAYGKFGDTRGKR